jgi:sialic acid synthase SpsE
MLAAKKPGTGIPARRLAELVGRRARTDIAADAVLTEADVE